ILWSALAILQEANCGLHLVLCVSWCAREATLLWPARVHLMPIDLAATMFFPLRVPFCRFDRFLSRQSISDSCELLGLSSLACLSMMRYGMQCARFDGKVILGGSPIYLQFLNSPLSLGSVRAAAECCLANIAPV